MDSSLQPLPDALSVGDVAFPATHEHVACYLEETASIARLVDRAQLAALVDELAALQQRAGRLFVLGLGGSAANAAHAVNDARKLLGIESYAPTDSVAELTARINDEGFETCFVHWLMGSRLAAQDAVLVLSVGGGCSAREISMPLVRALKHARDVGARVLGVVGREGGHTAQVADACVVVPTVAAERVTPHTEGWQAVIWHLLVSHPRLQRAPTTW